MDKLIPTNVTYWIWDKWECIMCKKPTYITIGGICLSCYEKEDKSK